MIALFLRDRRFRVHIGSRCSFWRHQKNVLPQSSVLSPSLFNVYINDLPQTASRKFIYADDICLGAQRYTFTDLDDVLNGYTSDLFPEMETSAKPSKTTSSVFHLHNAKAHQYLNVSLGGQKIRHDPNPAYLGITLDRSLTFHDHLRKTAAKVGTRNNLLSMLAGSSWGASAPALRTSALALCYSVAEYCAPV